MRGKLAFLPGGSCGWVKIEDEPYSNSEAQEVNRGHSAMAVANAVGKWKRIRTRYKELKAIVLEGWRLDEVASLP